MDKRTSPSSLTKGYIKKTSVVIGFYILKLILCHLNENKSQSMKKTI